MDELTFDIVLKVSEEVEGTAGVGLDMRLLFEETA
jgi:hypothetical protein